MKKFVFISEGVIQFFIGFGGFIAGFFMIINPDGDTLKIPLSLLEDSPFEDFLIPGIILFIVNGLGNLIACFLSFRQYKIAGLAGIFFGMALMIWIFIQVSMIGGGHWLQYLYFGLGIVELLLGMAIRELI